MAHFTQLRTCSTCIIKLMRSGWYIIGYVPKLLYFSCWCWQIIWVKVAISRKAFIILKSLAQKCTFFASGTILVYFTSMQDCFTDPNHGADIAKTAHMCFLTGSAMFMFTITVIYGKIIYYTYIPEKCLSSSCEAQNIALLLARSMKLYFYVLPCI